MVQISFSGAFTAATAIVPDLYINAQPPGQGVIMPASFGLVGIEGAASWGPVNKTTLIGQAAQIALYGNPVNRSNDLVSAATIILQAQQQAGIGANMVLNRVTDTTDTAASGDVGSVAANTETATVAGTLTIGDQLSLTATSAGITGSPVTVSYTTKAGDTPTTEAAALAAAVNANVNLQAANISATSAAGVVTLAYPTTLTVTWSKTITGAGSETITLATGSATTIFGLALTSLYTGSGANGDGWALAAGSTSVSATPTWRLTLQHPNFPIEVYDNIGAGLTGNALWQAIANAVNNGNSPLRGPSGIMVATAGGSSAAPAAATGTLSGGTDGTGGLTSAKFVGTDTAPRSGIYAFRASGVSDLIIADFDDVTQESNFTAFGMSEGILVHTNGPPGETPTAGQTAKQTQGTFGTPAAWVKRWLGDWCYWNDNFNGVQRLMGPATFGVAVNSTLQPQQSPLNKPVTGVVATQRTKSGIPYGSDELAVLTSSGIDVVTNPIPAGSIFGVRIGCNASALVATFGDEWPRLTSFIARSLAGPGAIGTLIGQDITADFFTEGYDMLDVFLSGLQNPGSGSPPLIQAYQITFSQQNNPQSQTGKGIVVAQVLVQFLGIARIFLVNLQTGATVVIPANSNIAAAAAALAA